MANTMCICCLRTTSHRDCTTEYYFNGVKEVYSEMIMETFNIVITEKISKMCEECIVQLRDSSTFKKQVECSQKTILEMLNETDEIKMELSDENSSFHSEMAEWSPNNNDILKSITKCKSKINVSNGVKKLKKSNMEGAQKCIKKKVKEKTVKGIQPDSDLKEDSLKLIKNSNMCLFKSLKTKYKCYLCREVYRNITELRTHWPVHKTDKDLQTIALRHRGVTFKNADISNLNCQLCNLTLTDIDNLKTHLSNEHKVKFKSEKHFLIPYKLIDGFVCVICNQNFNTFLCLSVHMNLHFANNVCESCGRSFINRQSLRTHVNAMHREKKCSKCKALFYSNYARIKHMRTIHNTNESKRYCLDCNKTFRYTYLLNDHMVESHGVAKVLSNCNVCNKTFQSSQNLKIHMRSVHIKERNHPCAVCGMRFFTKCDKVRHERTHEDVRSFLCNHCDGKFKSKDSLRRHLKRQHCCE